MRDSFRLGATSAIVWQKEGVPLGESFAPQHHQQILDTLQEGNSGTGQTECGGAPFSETNSDNGLGEGHHAITSLFLLFH